MEYTMEKLDWNVICGDLQKDFNDEELCFLEALSIVAQAKIDETSGTITEKEKVHKAIDEIFCYVRMNKSANEKINNMFGFAEDKKSEAMSEETWEQYLDELSRVSVKEYLYFIADMKIKSTVYLLRVHNFVKNGGLENVYLTEKRFIDNIKEIVNIESFYSDVQRFFGCGTIREKGSIDAYFNGEEQGSTLSSEDKMAFAYIEKCKKFVEEVQSGWDKVKHIAEELREMESEVLDKNNAKRSGAVQSLALPAFQQYDLIGEYKIAADYKYYLFDNSMREIKFTGIGWEWLWKYEQSKADLFRCSDGQDNYDLKGDSGKSGREFYQFMIATIVRHMNNGENKPKLASYSKNPFRDIYKYMSVKKQEGFYLYKIRKTDNEEYIAELYLRMGEEEKPVGTDDAEKYRNTVFFSLIKNGETNTISDVKDGIVRNRKSFSEFITEQEPDDSDAHFFCVDILNNTVFYKGDVRRVFGEYVSQFPEVDSKQLQSAIVASSDKEVVMWWDKNIAPYKEIILLEKCPENYSYDDFRENVEYRIELTKQDVIGLFYSIWKDNRKKNNVFFDQGNVKEDGKFSISKKDIRIDCELVEEKQKPAGEDEILDMMTVAEERKRKEWAIKESIKRDIMSRGEIYACNNWKINLIQVFLKEYQRKYSCFEFGETVYGEKTGDMFVNFCRNLFLQ